MEIRPYRPDDLDELYEHPELLGHVFVAPFAVHQPELAFVATDAEGVAGYVLGAADVRACS